MKIKNCNKCKLSKTRTQVVIGKGNIKSDIMFIGEAPGKNEDKKGIPFCGRVGKVLDQIVVELGYKRKEVYITNSVKCRPPKNRTPYDYEVDVCSEWLIKELMIIKPKIIITLGLTAKKFINMKFNDKMNGVYSSDEHYPLYRINIFSGIYLFNMMHPAATLYSNKNKDKLVVQIESLLTWMSVIGFNKDNKMKVKENKLVKSKWRYGYFSGNYLISEKIKNHNDVSLGDVYYNQNITNDKNWGETIKRKGLRVIQIAGDYGSDVFVRFFIYKNGNRKILNKKITKKKLFEYIKGDK